MLVIWTLTATFASEDLVSVMIISRYYRYDMSLSNLLLEGLIDHKLARGGPVGWEWKGKMLGQRSNSSCPGT